MKINTLLIFVAGLFLISSSITVTFAQEWTDYNSHDPGITTAQAIPDWVKTRSKYVLISDPISEFIDRRCDLDPLEEITKQKLHQEYKKFCVKTKIPPENIRAFGRILKRRFRGTINSKANWWVGITLKKKNT